MKDYESSLETERLTQSQRSQRSPPADRTSHPSIPDERYETQKYATGLPIPSKPSLIFFPWR